MEMRAIEDIEIAQNLTPPSPPLAFSLYNSTLLSHCSACSSPLPLPPLLPTFPANSQHVPNPKPQILYCSSQCSLSDSQLQLSTAEYHLLLLSQSQPATCHISSSDDTSDLRAALRLLHTLRVHCLPESNRLHGLMTNRDELVSNGDVWGRIRSGAKAMAAARRMRDGLGLDFDWDSLGECLVEEAVLCLVLTNAVEVQVKGGFGVGVAVYDTTFSWINHSCSPNACYRFLPPDVAGCSGDSRLRIEPAATGAGGEIQVSQDSVGCLEYGPRIIVRSMKDIKKGEEVSIAYTDLLQPKATRQSELWLKYQFVCRCKRCISCPESYVDQTLQRVENLSCPVWPKLSDGNHEQVELSALLLVSNKIAHPYFVGKFMVEISAVDLDCTNLSHDNNFDRDEVNKKLTDYVDEAISEYLSHGNPESCCDKLENMLTHGLLDDPSEPKEEKSQKIIRLHPLHHLSLNAYTTLASAYKIRATDVFAISPYLNEHHPEVLKLSRLSAGYSLLLATATHHLFLSERSLLASVANFWTNAGESLLSLARSPVWDSFTNPGSVVSELSLYPSRKCCKCALVDGFEANFERSDAQNGEFEHISREFLNCIRNITPKVWRFLVSKGCYLQVIKDPIEFRWLETVKYSGTFDGIAHVGDSGVKRSVCTCEDQDNASQERVHIFELGVHCLLYGGFLSVICDGQHSYLTFYIRNLLYDPVDNIDS